VIRAYANSISSIRISTAISVLITREQPCPVHIAGNARILARSLMQRRRRLISYGVSSVSILTSLANELRTKMRLNEIHAVPAALARILREAERTAFPGGLDSTDDDHRMSSHYINNNIPAELCYIVRTYDWVDGPSWRSHISFALASYSSKSFT
jgi:hypothetical protein